MPKEFKTNKRLLTREEKIRRAIFFYTFDNLSFDLEYEDGDDIDDYGQPLIKIDENYNKLDSFTKSLVDEFVKREIYDETIDFKCLSCSHEEKNIDWEEIEEMWDGKNYPIMYCPKCNKPKFVPIDIWNKANK